MQGVSKEQLAGYKNRLIKKHLSRGVYQFSKFHADNLPYAYHNYKEKCLSWNGGLICKKDHSHEREIVSDARSPIKGHVRFIARAVRLTKLLSKEYTWTLWSMANLQHDRHAHLTSYAHICKNLRNTSTAQKHVPRCQQQIHLFENVYI